MYQGLTVMDNVLIASVHSWVSVITTLWHLYYTTGCLTSLVLNSDIIIILLSCLALVINYEEFLSVKFYVFKQTAVAANDEEDCMCVVKNGKRSCTGTCEEQ